MLAYFERLINYSCYQNDLEDYIKTRRPLSTADVERLIKEYNYETTKVWI